MTVLLSILLALAFIPMLLEARRSRANERALFALGAREPEGDVYRVMQIAYPAGFALMAGEAWLRQRRFAGLFFIGVAVFVAAKLLKYWAIATLGPRWTFRVLVLPGSPLVSSGPYHYMRHPNYAAVIGELFGMMLMAQAPVTGMVCLIVFAALIKARIGIEERALGVIPR